MSVAAVSDVVEDGTIIRNRILTVHIGRRDGPRDPSESSGDLIE